MEKIQNRNRDSVFSTLGRATAVAAVSVAILGSTPKIADSQTLAGKELLTSVNRASNENAKNVLRAQFSLTLPNGFSITVPIPEQPVAPAPDYAPAPDAQYAPAAPAAGVWFQDGECWAVNGYLNCYPGVVVTAIPEGIVMIAPDVLLAPGIILDPGVRWGGRYANDREFRNYHDRHEAGYFRRPENRAYNGRPEAGTARREDQRPDQRQLQGGMQRGAPQLAQHPQMQRPQMQQSHPQAIHSAPAKASAPQKKK